MLRLEVFLAGVLSLSFSPAALGGIVTYDGTVFPETQGWRRSTGGYFSDRSLSDGWLIQQAEVVPQDPPNLDASEDDFYYHSVAEFAGSETFFLEWRVQTDGQRSGFPNVSPAPIVAGGTRGILYHFTIAEDQVRLIDSNLSVLLFDIEVGIPHTYRLELYGTESYSFLIDGHVVDSGVPEGAYPTLDSEIVFGGRAVHGQDITTVRWDYVTYGAIPEPATGLLLLAGSAFAISRRKSRLSPRRDQPRYYVQHRRSPGRSLIS